MGKDITQLNIEIRVHDSEGNVYAPEVRLEESMLSNFHFIVIDDDELEFENFPVGMLVDVGEQKPYLIGDRVEVKADTMGWIAPGITRPGFGTITEICEDYSDHFFGVQMDDGEFGYLKLARIEVVHSVLEPPSNRDFLSDYVS